MRAILICAILFFINLQAFSQQTDEGKNRLSIEFNNISASEAVQLIEENSDFKFYYIDAWLEGIVINQSYTNETVSKILQDLFTDQPINFYIDDKNQIFLTQNVLVFENLPEDFLGKKDSIIQPTITSTDSLAKPRFFSRTQQLSDTQFFRIGKETKGQTATTLKLTGRVSFLNNNQPVSDATIVKRGSTIGTTTNGNGNFELNLPPGESYLDVGGFGIQPRSFRVLMYSSGSLELVVQESFEILDEVVVESDRDRNVRTAITGLTTIEIEEIKTIPLVLGERDLLKVAVTLPGISTAGEGATGFNVRGGRTDQNLILLDDAVIYNPTHFFGIFSAFNPFSTGSVDIYKGTIPAEYGGRLSSVIDIRSKDASTDEVKAEASIGPVTANAVVEFPLIKEKAGLLIGGRATYSNWILNSLDEKQLQNSKASFYDFIAKFNYDINENNSINATGYTSKDRFSITSDSLFGYQNNLVALKWDHKFNQNHSGALQLTNSRYLFDIDFDGESNNDFLFEYYNDETELKFAFDYKPEGKHQFKYGLSSKLYRINPGEINPSGSDSEINPLNIPLEKGLESAIYISDSFRVNEKLLLEGGLRYSFFAALGPSSQRLYDEGGPINQSTFAGTEDFGPNEVIETYGGPEVRFAARYFLQPELSIKAGYTNVYQYIHTLSSNTTVSPTDTWKLSDSNIEPQRASQYSLGIFKNIDGNKYELSLEGYYKTQKDLLDYKVGAQLLLNEAIERQVIQGDGKAYGAELLLKKNDGDLNGWIGYTYSRSFVRLDSEFEEERVNNGEFFPSNFDKPHDVSIVANYKFTKRFSVSLNYVYQTGRPITYPIGIYRFNNADYVYYSDRNEFRIPDYHRLDLSFNAEGNHKIKKFAHSFWTFSIYNVLGRDNPYSVFFVTDNGELKAFQSSIFSIPVPTLTYNFKF